MYVMGIPVTVTVDEYLPFVQFEDEDEIYMVYGKPSRQDRGLWMPILEKVAAKLFGNYEMLVGGDERIAVSALTGAPFFQTMH